MLSLLTLALWFGGLYALLAGHLFIGGALVMLALPASVAALKRRDDMESMFGAAFGLVIIAGVVIGAVEGWRTFIA